MEISLVNIYLILCILYVYLCILDYFCYISKYVYVIIVYYIVNVNYIWCVWCLGEIKFLIRLCLNVSYEFVDRII